MFKSGCQRPAGGYATASTLKARLQPPTEGGTPDNKKKVKMFQGSEILVGVGVSGLLWENVRGSGNDDSPNSVQVH